MHIYIKKAIVTFYKILLAKKFNIPFSSTWLLSKAFIRDWKKKKVSYIKILKIHNKGFTVDDWLICNLNQNNYKKHMTNAQYYGMHPLNGRYSCWIDDKLTLKYLCTGILDKYMPEYYFLINTGGIVYNLIDSPYIDNININFVNVIELLKRKNMLALKRVAGSLGEGFYKAECIDGDLYLNGVKYTQELFIDKLETLKDYIVMEYLEPHKELAKYCPDTVNCIRYLAGKVDGKLELLKSFIRFGNKNSGYVENYAAGGVLCYLNKNGEFSEGNMLDIKSDKNIIVSSHPDNGVKLKGKIPHWIEICNAVDEFGRVFPHLNYLGFDFVITKDNQVKILEINSLSSYDALNLYDSILESESGVFFKTRIKNFN